MSTLKKISSTVLFAIGIATGAGASDGSPSKQSEVVTITPVRTPYWLNNSELASFQELALKGDLGASYCLANYYGIEVDKDPDRTYWILIAAENGDADAMTLISGIYQTESIPRARARTDFWRLRAESTRSHKQIACHKGAP